MATEILREKNGVTLTKIVLTQGTPEVVVHITYKVEYGTPPRTELFRDLISAKRCYEDKGAEISRVH